LWHLANANLYLMFFWIDIEFFFISCKFSLTLKDIEDVTKVAQHVLGTCDIIVSVDMVRRALNDATPLTHIFLQIDVNFGNKKL
jgi:hypothetical protein